MSHGGVNREFIVEAKRKYHADFVNMFKIILTELRTINHQAKEPIFIIDRPAIRIKKGVSVCKNILRELKVIRTPEDVLKNFPDFLGVRVICLDLEKVWQLRDALMASGTIEIFEEKDYISHPEPDGYRSLHLLVRAKNRVVNPLVVAEVQIRTPAQHCWATLTYRDAYKDRYILPKSLEDRFRALSEQLHELDQELKVLRQQIAISPLTDEARHCTDVVLLDKEHEPTIVVQEWWASGETFY
jgi:putative GTP pyrophosphokinase